MADKSTSTKVQNWSVPDAVKWIAFRTEPAQAPAIIVPKHGAARSKSTELMGALRARVAGDPRSWPPKGVHVRNPMLPELATLPDYPAWQCRAKVKFWMRETKLSATDLLALADAEKHRYEKDVKDATDQQAELSKALDDLNLAVASSRLPAYGRPSQTKSVPGSIPARELITASYIDEPRRINWSGCFHIREDGDGFQWIDDPGPFFYDIQVPASDVRRLWPCKAASSKRPLPRPVLLAWWETYLQQHRDLDKRPNAKQQQADADAYFGAQGTKGPTVRGMRKLRAEPSTPPEWREAGRL